MKTLTTVLACAALALSLTACGSDGSDTAASGDATSSAAAGSTADAADGADAAASLELASGWAKAAPDGMTSLYGSLTNPGSADITLVSGTSPAAGKVEFHEVVDKDGKATMQMMESGLVVPANSAAELAPGSNHIMLMELTGPIKAGDTVEVTLTDSNGTDHAFSVTAREADAGEEPYDGGEHAGHGSHGGGATDGAATDKTEDHSNH